jgi:glycosyltransferase involved in cell wall biosynthesis
LRDGSLVVIDGLAYGALPELAEAEGRRLRLIALVHHPLAGETDLSPAKAALLFRSERRALSMASAVIVTSCTTAARLIQDYSVPRERLAVALPGSDPAMQVSSAADSGGVVDLLSIATVTHRKGHDLLVEALARLADLSWTCNIVGSLDRSPEFAAKVRRQITAYGLDQRVHLWGSMPDLSPFYECADIFVLASRYEGYGMVFAEALQHGLPVVATTAGAIPEAVPPTAGLLVPPEDVAAISAAIRRLIVDPTERGGYSAGARAAAALLPGWGETAVHVAEVLRRVAGMNPALI